jgi:hypothetical protein
MLLHLRRLVTPRRLPTHLRSSRDDTTHDAQTISLLLPQRPLSTQEAIVATLKPHIQDADHLPAIQSTRIPLHPPISAEQAANWSLNY